MNKCDTCNIENDKVVAGRWLFYCSNPICRKNDSDKTYENEIEPMLENDMTDMLDGELMEYAELIF